MSYRTWSATVNNPAADYGKDVFERLVASGDIRYAIAGAETGDSGTPHLQCTITFSKPHRMRAVSAFVPRAHLEPTRSLEDSITYCKKDGDFTEYGTPAKARQGKRTDLKDAIETLRESGIEALKLLHAEVWCKYPRGLSTLIDPEPRDPSNPPIVTWLYGGTGLGKTRQVVELEQDLWISGSSLKWWNGYKNQAAVLFDDFRGDFSTFHWLLRLLDRYPVRVEVKGSMVEFNSARIYITCPDHPTDVYPTIEDKQQLLRRIDRIIHVHGMGIFTDPPTVNPLKRKRE